MSVELNFDRAMKCGFPHYAHQKRGIKTALGPKDRYGFFWEMRLGKSRAIAEAACFAHEAGELDIVVLGVPAQVVEVWSHPELGECAKHCFVPYECREFNSGNSDILDMLMSDRAKGLQFVTMSHELLRQEDARGDFPRAKEAARVAMGKKAWLVFDEASAFGSWKSMQTKSALRLRDVLRPAKLFTLDGSPIGNSPMEQYSKFKLLGQDVLSYKNFFHFRAVHQHKTKVEFWKYDPVTGKKVLVTRPNWVEFKNQALIDAKVKPWCEYIEAADCLDLPPLVQSFMVVKLAEKSWRRYCEMRDEMVAELEDGRVCDAMYAASKAMRLAQLCSGFLGGVENEATGAIECAEVSDETLKETVAWAKRMEAQDSGFKCVVWARFRPEIERLTAALRKALDAPVGVVYGGKKEYREELHRDSGYAGPYWLVAQPQALRYGVDLSKATTQMYLSQNYDRVVRAQSEKRLTPGEGARECTQLVDVLVTGPQGQRTIVWDIKECLDKKTEVARRTAGEWKKALVQE